MIDPLDLTNAVNSTLIIIKALDHYRSLSLSQAVEIERLTQRLAEVTDAADHNRTFKGQS